MNITDWLFLLTVLFGGLPITLALCRSWRANTGTSVTHQYDQSISVLPDVTIVVPTWNEANTIVSRMENISTLNYPTNKISILVVDDNSDDGTPDKASRAMSKFGVRGDVIKKPSRTGVTESVEIAIQNANSHLVVWTDCDISTGTDALRNLVSPLIHSSEIGLSCGRLKMRPSGNPRIDSLERQWRRLFDTLALRECRTLGGTLNIYGQWCCFRRDIAVGIHGRYGATDPSFAFATLRRGLRICFLDECVFEEYIDPVWKEYRKQKIRRIRRSHEALFLHFSALFRPGVVARSAILWRLINNVCGPVGFVLSFLSLNLWLLSHGFFVISTVLVFCAPLGCCIQRIRPNPISASLIGIQWHVEALARAFRSSPTWEPVGRLHKDRALGT